MSDDRFNLPKAEIFYEGNTSVIKNFDKISDAVNREPDEILKYLLGGLGTAGERSGSRVIFQGKIRAEAIQAKLKDYIDNYVICIRFSTLRTCELLCYLSSPELDIKLSQ